MKGYTVKKRGIALAYLPIVCATAFVVAFTVGLPGPALADQITPPAVPGNLVVELGYEAFFAAHAAGTQAYICLPTAEGATWTFYGPQATLFEDNQDQVATHFLSPNPLGGGTLRATWQHSRDTSTVWAVAVASSTDAAYVEPGAIAWLLLRVVGAQEGPNGGDKLSPAVFIHRVNTVGGVAPSTGCSSATDVGKRAFVPYSTDYIFYQASGR